MESMEVTLGEFYKNKRVLLTGHTGFKGAWLSAWLNKMGAEVYGYALAPDDSQPLFDLLGLDARIEHTVGDIRDYESLLAAFKNAEPEIVFHLAAQSLVIRSYENPQFNFETNVSGSVNVLEAVRQSPTVRSVIYVTTDKCYRNNEWIWGYRENDRLGGHDPYSASKACAELVLESYQRSFFADRHDLGVASARAGNVIAGGDWAENRIVPDCIRALEKGDKIQVRNPAASRPWQHVLEPLGAYLSLAAKLYQPDTRYNGAWNIGPSIEANRSVGELVSELISCWGSGEAEFGVVSEDAHHEAGLLMLNCDKITHHLGWKPAMSFAQTVATTTDWYKRFHAGTDAWDLSSQQIDEYLLANQTIREIIDD